MRSSDDDDHIVTSALIRVKVEGRSPTIAILNASPQDDDYEVKLASMRPEVDDRMLTIA